MKATVKQAKKKLKLDRQVYSSRTKTFLTNAKPYVLIITWYVLLGFLFVGYINNDYSIKTTLFAFSLFFIYDKLYDDYIDLIKLKAALHGDKK